MYIIFFVYIFPFLFNNIYFYFIYIYILYNPTRHYYPIFPINWTLVLPSPPPTISRIRNLVPALEKARAYRGRGGEVIRQAACRDLGLS